MASQREAGERHARAADSVERVYAAVKALAVDYRLRPGEKINEVELAARLQVSRTPVRSALNRLERDGFVVSVPNKGFFARSLTPEAVRDLYELRAAVECAAFALACRRATREAIEATAQAWEAHAALAAPGTLDQVSLADEAFHLGLTTLSRNAQMVSALEGISSRIHFLRRIDLEDEARRGMSFAQHAKIIAALRRRDAAEGAALLEAHVTLSSANAMDMVTRGLARLFPTGIELESA
jgi:DNA-binding GntR family transcriptional regulator